jgi:hypothetical protein
VLADETVPGGRGPDRAEPLGEDGERAGRDVSIVGRDDHVPDCPDLARYGTDSATRAGIAGPQRHELAGPIHGAQDPHLGASVRHALFCEAKPGGSEQGQPEPEQRRELLDASPAGEPWSA